MDEYRENIELTSLGDKKLDSRRGRVAGAEKKILTLGWKLVIKTDQNDLAGKSVIEFGFFEQLVPVLFSVDSSWKIYIGDLRLWLAFETENLQV